MAIALLVFSITASMTIQHPGQDEESATSKQMNELNQTANPTIMSPESLKENNQPTDGNK